MAGVGVAGSIARITKEIAHIQQGQDLSLAVAFRESDIRELKALIVGPPESPYEFGFFEFEVKIGSQYPIKSPAVRCITTNGGRTRFNPNIYAEGKVCLSILGTWRGNPGEEWSSVQGLESVLLSIQSLMSGNPYENEPGFEEYKKDEPDPKAYINKIRHETLRITILQRLEGLLDVSTTKSEEPPRKKTRTAKDPAQHVGQHMAQEYLAAHEPSKSPSVDEGASTPGTDASAYEYDAEAAYNALTGYGSWDPFADLFKRRFLWYFDSYIKAIEQHEGDQKNGAPFKRMDFEYPPNSMDGSFEYKDLRKRMERIREALDEERQTWGRQGLKAVADNTTIATQLAFQFKQLQHKWNESQEGGSRLELNLSNPKNPFTWDLTFFGQPMTNLDGGIFRITLALSPRFPEEQPRVVFETPIFHHRVSKGTGVLCYFPAKADEIDSHLKAIVAALEDKNAIYDPRANVNPEAFALYWGGDESRKKYNRLLRRSAQESCEF